MREIWELRLDPSGTFFVIIALIVGVPGRP